VLIDPAHITLGSGLQMSWQRFALVLMLVHNLLRGDDN